MRTLDFNALEQPVMEITLKDTDRTKLRLTTPTEGLYQRMLAAGKDLKRITAKGNLETIKQIYALSAEIISCNTDGIKVTAEELRDVYGLKLYDIIVFMGAYVDFVKELASAKN